METKLLSEIGLTEGEIKIYLALLSLGEATSGPIAEKSGVSISKVYPILDRLSKKGLVSYIVKEKTKHFTAASPKRIIDYIDEKEKLLEEKKIQIEKILPALEARRKETVEKKRAEVFAGLRGIKTAREQALVDLKKGELIYIICCARSAWDRMAAYWESFHMRRIKKGILCRFIYNYDTYEDFGKPREKWKLTELRYLPKNYTTNSWIEIYKNSVTVAINLAHPFSIVIYDKDVVESFCQMAEFMWQASKPSKELFKKK